MTTPHGPRPALLGEVSMASAWCQRWRNGTPSWRHRSDGGFDPRRYRVEPIAEAQAKAFVTTHHYSRTYSAAVHRLGLFGAADELRGVAVFGSPMSQRVLTLVLPDLAPARESLEMSRFVLLDGPGNEESWFLARAFEHLAAAGVRGVVTFADPVPRRDAAGTVLCPGHIGVIYQAKGLRYAGRGTARTLTLLPDGTTLTDRAIQKVRRQEVGHAYVERRLIALGAPVPRAGHNPVAWLADALDTIGATRARHRGNHRYVAALGNRAERRQVRIAVPGQHYPKAIDTPLPEPQLF